MCGGVLCTISALPGRICSMTVSPGMDRIVGQEPRVETIDTGLPGAWAESLSFALRPLQCGQVRFALVHLHRTIETHSSGSDPKISAAGNPAPGPLNRKSDGHSIPDPRDLEFTACVVYARTGASCSRYTRYTQDSAPNHGRN